MPEVSGSLQDLLQPWISAMGIAVWSILALMLLRKIISVFQERAQLDISGRWIVVTGCDSGFGRGVVESLVARGAMVVACCFTREGAADALKAGAQLAPCLDLRDEEAILQLAGEIELELQWRTVGSCALRRDRAAGLCGLPAHLLLPRSHGAQFFCAGTADPETAPRTQESAEAG